VRLQNRKLLYVVLEGEHEEAGVLEVTDEVLPDLQIRSIHGSLGGCIYLVKLWQVNCLVCVLLLLLLRCDWTCV
jgi:hypothetical protein